ncbi:urease accessory protein [Nitrosospira sp. Nsp5]|uniref:Urease accessory protein UreD n=1 Tax=Nitrosospira multiformis TaxID=1231 RepID=A0ABY0THK6_9PROT|nr:MULTISPECIES: urease accessory protein UreD [Nitrosospira]PTR05055.1 urease accessory protein [Nitrosospira sp. Nsp5]SDQ84839.1 urease accessory protein [Nitrosospira multiformis]
MHLIPNAEESIIRRDPAASVHHLYPTQDSPDVKLDSGYTPLQARLSLGFRKEEGATRLVEREHFGPLLVQKPLYPEGREVCQVVIVHPPGGVVGGDQLEISARVGATASTQVTTPGAAKWYKANGHVSHQAIRLDVGVKGVLEWVPQETIFFDNVDVKLEHRVVMEKEASYIGCEILCFGRTASGESFTSGRIRQRTRIQYEGKLIWFEQLRLAGGSAGMKSPLLLGGNTICATLIAVGKAVSPTVLAAAREEAGEIAKGAGHLGISQLKPVITARYLGNSSETARQVMLHIWGLLRPAMLGREAMVPRMWKT